MPKVPFAKVHSILREKIKVFMNDGQPNDDDYRFVYDLPDELSELHKRLSTDKTLARERRAIAVSIRQMADETKLATRGKGRTQEGLLMMTSEAGESGRIQGAEMRADEPQDDGAPEEAIDGEELGEPEIEEDED